MHTLWLTRAPLRVSLAAPRAQARGAPPAQRRQPAAAVHTQWRTRRSLRVFITAFAYRPAARPPPGAGDPQQPCDLLQQDARVQALLQCPPRQPPCSRDTGALGQIGRHPKMYPPHRHTPRGRACLRPAPREHACCAEHLIARAAVGRKSGRLSLPADKSLGLGCAPINGRADF